MVQTFSEQNIKKEYLIGQLLAQSWPKYIRNIFKWDKFNKLPLLLRWPLMYKTCQIKPCSYIPVLYWPLRQLSK